MTCINVYTQVDDTRVTEARFIGNIADHSSGAICADPHLLLSSAVNLQSLLKPVIR